MRLTTVTVSVPEGKEADLLSYAAELVRLEPEGHLDGLKGQELPQGTEGDASDSENATRWNWAPSNVREAYFGGVSRAWRPFLEFLADHPDEWVAWPELCQHIHRTPREASGMLGAAERRCKRSRPYEKRWDGPVRYFRMPGDVAKIIREAAGESE